jgi:hypothetical protein
MVTIASTDRRHLLPAASPSEMRRTLGTAPREPPLLPAARLRRYRSSARGAAVGLAGGHRRTPARGSRPSSQSEITTVGATAIRAYPDDRLQSRRALRRRTTPNRVHAVPGGSAGTHDVTECCRGARVRRNVVVAGEHRHLADVASGAGVGSRHQLVADPAAGGSPSGHPHPGPRDGGTRVGASAIAASERSIRPSGW